MKGSAGEGLVKNARFYFGTPKKEGPGKDQGGKKPQDNKGKKEEKKDAPKKK